MFVTLYANPLATNAKMGQKISPGRRAFVDVLAAIQTASQTIQLHSRPFTNNEMAGTVTLSSTA